MTLDGNALRLKTFCQSALCVLGVDVTEDAPDLLSVSIPSSRLDLFDGRPSLKLAFSSDRLGPDTEFVVSGSYVLERILERVRCRGSVNTTYLRPAVEASPASGVKLENADVRLISSRTAYHAILASCFRVSLVTDENEDRLCRVLVDLATGKQLRLDPAQFPGTDESLEIEFSAADLDRGFAASRSLAEDFARGEAGDLQAQINERLTAEMKRLDEYYAELLSDRAHGKGADIRKLQKFRDRAATSYGERSRAFEVAADLLKQASTFTELASASGAKRQAINRERRGLARKIILDYAGYARELARFQAEEKALAKGQDIAYAVIRDSNEKTRSEVLERMRRQALDKLKADSEQKETTRFSEDSTADLEGVREELDKEKARRVAELQDKFQLKVVIAPVSVSVIGYPRMESVYSAVSGGTSAGFTTAHDLVFDRIEGPTCHQCGSEMSSAYLCSCGSLVCPSCHRTCAVCGKILCAAHSVVCPDCGSVVCPDEMRKCDDCGVEACKVDVADCPACGRAACRDHRTECALCGQSVCRGCITQSGRCETCDSLFTATSSVSAIEQILSELAHVDPRTGRWLIGENDRQFTLVHPGLRTAVYVVDKSPCRLRTARTLGLLDSLRFRLKT